MIFFGRRVSLCRSRRVGCVKIVACNKSGDVQDNMPMCSPRRLHVIASCIASSLHLARVHHLPATCDILLCRIAIDWEEEHQTDIRMQIATACQAALPVAPQLFNRQVYTTTALTPGQDHFKCLILDFPCKDSSLPWSSHRELSSPTSRLYIIPRGI